MLRPSSVSKADTFPRGGGEGYVKGDNFKIKRFATVRYETGEACPPGGRLNHRQDYSNSNAPVYN